MLELAPTPQTEAASASLAERLDELSTRLLVQGAASLTAGDFEQLANDAPHDADISLAAKALAEALTRTGDSADPELARVLAEGLEQLQRLLERTPEESRPNASSGAEAAPLLPLVEAEQFGVLAADEDMIREFITESGEHLSKIEGQLLLLEKDNKAVETLNAVFRAFHTIKGLAGFLEFPLIQALAHEVETLLDLARTFVLEVTPPVIDVILESTDVVRHELTRIELQVSGKPSPPTLVTEALLADIRNIAHGKDEESAGLASAAAVSPPVASPHSEARQAGPQTASDQPIAPDTAGVKPGAIAQSTAAPAKEKPGTSSAAPEAVPQRASAELAKPADAASVRIDTAKIDQLMDMVGEMVIAQTLIGHSPALASVKDTRLLRDLTQLARITTDVQRITTGMRMVPIGLQFQKTARLIRDLSRKAGKQIVLETSGEDTELDKSIAEELSDPLLHMVRNSIDHGIETPPERVAAGKDATAHIRLAAYHQSGQIVVEIGDDGRGLNCQKILAKAQQNGLIQPGAQLSDQETFLLIFEAGFSTAEKVTDISGRGVGMDVVRKHVQKLRGRIEIQSQAGKGTTFFIKLPLTLAIIEGLVVTVGDQRYIVPIFSVREMFRPAQEMLSTVQGTGEMALVRGGLLPIVRLHRRFNTRPRTEDFTQGVLIVAESGGRQFCLFVDELVGKQEVVIKSLGESFKHVEGIAGCAILGDGRVGLILDIDGIYKGRC
jgi:two-component system chemotaxis sensor kinase CheA